MISNRLEKLAGEFWEEAGQVIPFPRDLEHLIACTYRVNVELLADLSIASIRRRLALMPHSLGLDVRNRRLFGCLVAFKECGTIFVEASLPLADRRVVIAHEFGHFLADYLDPRRRATRRVGPHLLKIFDGERPATETERLEATLAGVELAPHLHYMERTQQGTYLPATSQVEQRANELALELLAPWRQVPAILRARGSLAADSEGWTAVLIERFGLPASWAHPYAAELLASNRARRSFTETLGL